MIRLKNEDVGTHIVRLLPNISELKNSTIVQRYYCYEKKQITANDYWALKYEGKKPHDITRYFSYARVDDNYGLWQHGRTIQRFIRACMNGTYYIMPDGDFLLEEEFNPEKKYERVDFKPFIPYDLTHNKAIQFDLKIHELGFQIYSNFKIIESEEYRIYKEGDDKNFITGFLEQLTEEIPEPVLF